MTIKSYKPITPGRRFMKTVSEAHVAPTGTSKKSLVVRLKKTGGRNNLGRITCRHKGGGYKRLYRIVDFKRAKDDIPAVIQAIEYDPNRSAYIALVAYNDGEKRYIIAPQTLKVGDRVVSGLNVPIRVGNTMPLSKMPVGSIIHNIELVPGQGGKMVRSAGLSAQLKARDDEYAIVEMPSREVRRFSIDCRATLGSVSKPEHSSRVIGKAGKSRHLGIRPTVRGCVMNPVDHARGGGEGKHNGHLRFSPNANFVSGQKTRRPSKSTWHLVKSRKDSRKG